MVQPWKVSLFTTYSDEADVAAVEKVIRRGTFWANGPEIEEFEQAVAAFVGTNYALTFNSGTSALHALLLSYNVRNGEVIVPSFTFIATVNAVVLAGAKPIFAEVEPETFSLDFKDVEKKITPNTKAIIPIHFGGCLGRDIGLLRELCYLKRILLIEDAAQSLGASVKGKKAGTFGQAAMFSLCQNKVITCGEGGIVVTNDREIYEKLKLLRSHGRFEPEGEDYFSNVNDNDYLEAGYNFRLSTMSAALALSQFKKIELLIEKRKRTAAIFNKEFGQLSLIKCPLSPVNFEHLYQMYTITLKNKEIRDKLQMFLADGGIMTKVYFNPVHLKQLYRRLYGTKEGDLPFTEDLSNRVLTLPMSASISDEQISLIINLVKEFFSTWS